MKCAKRVTNLCSSNSLNSRKTGKKRGDLSVNPPIENAPSVSFWKGGTRKGGPSWEGLVVPLGWHRLAFPRKQTGIGGSRRNNKQEKHDAGIFHLGGGPAPKFKKHGNKIARHTWGRKGGFYAEERGQ